MTLATGPERMTLDGKPVTVDGKPVYKTPPDVVDAMHRQAETRLDYEPLTALGQTLKALADKGIVTAPSEQSAQADEQTRLAYLAASKQWRADLARCTTYGEFTDTMAKAPQEPSRADWLMNSWRVDDALTEPTDTMKLFAQAVNRDRVLPTRIIWVDQARKQCLDVYGERYLTCDPGKLLKRDQLDKATSLILAGNVGTGKTTSMIYHVQRLAERMAMDPKHHWEQPLFACYRTSTLFDILFDGDNATPWEALNAQYLVLDDVGREYSSPFPLHRFEELVEARYADRLGFIITTNMDKATFLAREGWDRIADRLVEVCSWIDVTRPTSLRKQH